jgi:lipopolysaccharide/colanic/teichoic acid biosynthesis glycosyltransferase
MNLPLTVHKRNARKNCRFPFPFADHLLDKETGLFVQEHFNELLYMERKRTERSRRPFLLMLASVQDVNGSGDKNEIMEKIAAELFVSTREIDAKGWYEYQSTIGAIFSEGMGVKKNEQDIIRHKVYTNLNKTLDLEQLKKIRIFFHVFPNEDDAQKNNDPPDLTVYPDLPKRDAYRRNSLLLKRAIDILGSLMGLILFSPLFLIIPLLIKLFSRGPVLYQQTRIGRHGEKFTFLKFRTMYINNNHNPHREYVRNLISGKKSTGKEGTAKQEAVYKITHDPRITRIGHFLRKTSLDELPQFFNVLKGEMSLVGPRPPIPYEIEEYDIWHRRRFLETKPGITGLWQVRGRSTTTFDDMVRLDLQYSIEWSLWLDIKILLQTPKAVLSGKGAY